MVRNWPLGHIRMDIMVRKRSLGHVRMDINIGNQPPGYVRICATEKRRYATSHSNVRSPQHPLRPEGSDSSTLGDGINAGHDFENGSTKSEDVDLDVWWPHS